MTKTMISSQEALKQCKKLDGKILAAIKAHFESGADELNYSKVFNIPKGSDCYINAVNDNEEIESVYLNKRGEIFVDFYLKDEIKVDHGTHSTADLATILSAIEKAKA